MKRTFIGLTFLLVCSIFYFNNKNEDKSYNMTLKIDASCQAEAIDQFDFLNDKYSISSFQTPEVKLDDTRYKHRGEEYSRYYEECVWFAVQQMMPNDLTGKNWDHLEMLSSDTTIQEPNMLLNSKK